MKSVFLFIIIMFLLTSNLLSQPLYTNFRNANSEKTLLQNSQVIPADSSFKKDYKNSIDVSPLSPFINIYAVHYIRKIYEKGEIITGLSYMRIKYDFGNTNSPAIIAGYRQYLWKNLHIEYEVWPAYDNFYEKNENKYYKSFDIWNEFRLGYLIDFKIGKIPFYVNIQWPFGFGLFSSNKPKSFKDHEKENRFFYQMPLIFTGVKF